MKVRRIHSIQAQLLAKSKEAALNAVQTFNNPLTTFKSETFIVHMVKAWMYLLHAYYRRQHIDYRYSEMVNVRRRFHRTKGGAFKYWSLEDCLKHADCPADKATKQNLFFLIGLRHEIEHQLCLGLDEHLSARYFACCLNYEATITKLFGEKHTVAPFMRATLQFSPALVQPSDEVTESALPASVTKYIQDFDDSLAEEDFNSPHFAVRLIFTQKQVNHPGQADKVIEFVAPDAVIGAAINKQHWVVKAVEKPKWRAGEVVAMMRAEGHVRFGPHQHVLLWKKLDGKNHKRNYCIELGGQWFWYENWVKVVREECKKHPELYGPQPDVRLTA